MKKRCLLLLSALVCLLSFVACGTTTEEKYGDYTSAQIESAMESQVTSLEGLSSEELAQYVAVYEAQAEQSDEEGISLYVDVYKTWSECRPEAGDFVAFSDFDISKSGKTVTATLDIDYSKRDMQLVYVFNANSMELTAVNTQLVYSLGETMAKAGLNTITGIAIVFAILILLSLLIYCFRFVSLFENKVKKTKVENVKTPVAQVSETVVEETDDTELIAVIAAAISASTGTSTDDFVVRSIKRRY
ncbi:sodium pump decarboxylases, gamma subunit [Lachnospiraceae bacterium A10]|nr:sodium pump decarboxylases, gamma subunit [Lachnospiraceae bacterium A10]